MHLLSYDQLCTLLALVSFEVLIRAASRRVILKINGTINVSNTRNILRVIASKCYKKLYIHRKFRTAFLTLLLLNSSIYEYLYLGINSDNFVIAEFTRVLTVIPLKNYIQHDGFYKNIN